MDTGLGARRALTIEPGAPERIRSMVTGWYDDLCAELSKYGLPLPAAANLKSIDDMWMAAVSWAPDASHQLISVSASFVRGDDFRAMLSCRPKRRDPTVAISWNDPMFSEVMPLIRALSRTLLKREEDRTRARADWDSIDRNHRAPWYVED